MASPAVVEQRAVVKDSELPKAVPTETEDPDRIVKPEADGKAGRGTRDSVVQAMPSVESVAVDATAMPSSD